MMVENMWVEIEKHNKSYIVGGIYRRPNQSVMKFTNSLEGTLIKINKKEAPCIIAGDINIDLLKYKTDKHCQEYLDSLLVHNFLPKLICPTRITPKTATLIDHIYYYP